MKISTFSIVIGNSGCDAACPYCISDSTGFDCLGDGKDINWEAFGRAVAFAQKSNTTTVLLTGKGEPTLFPKEITSFLCAFHMLGTKIPRCENISCFSVPIFPIIELQTNGIEIGRLAQAELDQKICKYSHLSETVLRTWQHLGLTTIAISTVGLDPTRNKEIFLHHRDLAYPDLCVTVRYLHKLGFQVRICVMMYDGGVDSIEKISETIQICRHLNIEQLTIRPLRMPDKPEDQYAKTDYWVKEHQLPIEMESKIHQWLHDHGTQIYTFTAGEHQFLVYDVKGQNVCFADCLTVSKQPDTIRTLIFYPHSGRLAYHWQYPTSATL
jgi:hypothetical protein